MSLHEFQVLIHSHISFTTLKLCFSIGSSDLLWPLIWVNMNWREGIHNMEIIKFMTLQSSQFLWWSYGL